MRNFLSVLTIMAAMFLTGCNKDGSILSVDVSGIVAMAEGGDYVMNIKADDSWNALAVDSKGLAVDWVAMRPGSGSGSASIPVHVKINNTEDDRSATIIISGSSGKKVSVSLSQNSIYTEDEYSARVRIGSFNIRLSGEDDNMNKDGWQEEVGNRRDRVRQVFRADNFDIIGLQEVGGGIDADGEIIASSDGRNNAGINVMQSDLREDLGDTWEFEFFSPYGTTETARRYGGSASGLAYKKDKLTLLEFHYFWLSETPSVMVYNDDTHSRGGTCGIFQHNATGIKFFFMAIHGCLNSEQNTLLAPAVIEIETLFNPDGLPSFFVGDLNTTWNTVSSKTYRTYWKDAYYTLGYPSGKVVNNSVPLEAPGNITGPWGTFCGFDETKDMTKTSRIDYIYFRGDSGVTPLHYTCDDNLYNNKYPSDHLPIYCDFRIRQENNQ